jgi:parallel beta-helix repeat protein
MPQNAKKIRVTALLLVLCFALVATSKIGVTKASPVEEPIRISVEVEGTDKIQRNGTVYTLTDNIVGSLDDGWSGLLTVVMPNVIIDGAGFTIHGDGKGYGVMIRQNNVTVKNLNIENFLVGISFFGADHPNDLMPYNQKILNNTIATVDTDEASSRNYMGFGIYAEYANNTVISGNTITTTNPEKGIYLGRGCYNNTLINNKLVGCGLNVYRPGDNSILNNTIDGKPILQFNSVSNQLVADAEQVVLFNCTNMTIKNVHPSSNYRYAIQLTETRNSTITDCEGRIFLANSDSNVICSNNLQSIELVACNHNKIFTNTITDTSTCIMFTDSCNYNDIYGNILSKSSMGIQFAYSGMSQHNDIYWNIITNSTVGIESAYSTKSSIHDNHIADCNIGIRLRGTDQNRIFQNNITRCRYAVWIIGSDNVIYNNNFIENKQQVIIEHMTLFSSTIILEYSTNNTFNLGYPVGGNFWSNYNGTDTNGDNIGDTPYIINENNTDHHPLMTPVDITSIPEFPSWIVLPMLLTATLMATVYRKKMPRTQTPST